MKKAMIFATFMLSTLAWAGVQQPAAGQSGAPAGAPGASQGQSSSMPDTSAAPGAAGQSTSPEATPQASGAPAAGGAITEGCLGGSSPNFTLTDASGKSFKLNLPANADGSKLSAHVGESVQVMGDVKADSIAVSKVGKGNGTCPAK
ncbi:hypothetical protein [Candidatus Korobacter versatilis]|nr:hypothetical protein [Candidatus Koribacter versatilis]